MNKELLEKFKSLEKYKDVSNQEVIDALEFLCKFPEAIETELITVYLGDKLTKVCSAMMLIMMEIVRPDKPQLYKAEWLKILIRTILNTSKRAEEFIREIKNEK